MKRLAFIFFLIACSSPVFAQQDSAKLAGQYRDAATKILASSMQDSLAYTRLAELCDRFGPRLSGTPNLERAIDWCLEKLKADGFDNVRSEPVKVPYWIRGDESCELLQPRPKSLAMLGLGGSVSTPPDGLTAEVLVVGDFEELEQRSKEANGKIVLFNSPFTNYGETVRIRVLGAQRAAKHGAVASLIRSVGPFSMNTPHTGGMAYADSLPKIPHAALSLEDAEMLSRMSKRGEKIVVKLKMSGKFAADSALSRNVIAEIKGTDKPDEIIAFGGHIDSWDVGQGAMDDGGGCLVSWQALKLIKQLGLKPKRTLRLVLWTNEENGMRGAKSYAERHATEKHVFCLESDAGVFKPTGFSFAGKEPFLSMAKAVTGLLSAMQPMKLSPGSPGADVAPLVEKGVSGVGLLVDGTKYFWYHHTHADTMDKLNPKEMNDCVAAIALMVYVASDFQFQLP